MDLIDRYVHEVTSSLPRKLRRGCLQGTSLDSRRDLESRRDRYPTEDAEDVAVAVLKDFGHLESSLVVSAEGELSRWPDSLPRVPSHDPCLRFVLAGLILLGLFTGLGMVHFPQSDYSSVSSSLSTTS